MFRRQLSAGLLAVSVAACASNTPDPEARPETPVRLADIEAPIARGDCTEALRRALAKPTLDVEKLAAPVAMNPLPIDTRKMPKGVADKNGYYEVKFEVLVDTLGKADMKTFSVVTASNPWLGTSVKAAVAKWRFTPAEVAGCKVPRTYSLGISPRGRAPSATPTASAKKPPR